MEESETAGMNSENARKSNIEKRLFGAMFLWPVILLVLHTGLLYSLVAYYGFPIFTTILIGIALRYYPASRRFLQWFAAVILVIALYMGVMYYGYSLQYGWKWLESVIRTPVVRFDGLLVVLSIIYLSVPQRAWGWLGARVKLLWKRGRHGRSI
jgi:hypothetical protein